MLCSHTSGGRTRNYLYLFLYLLLEQLKLLGVSMMTNQSAKIRTKVFIKTIVNSILILPLFGLPLFLPAGTLLYWNAWFFIGFFILFYFSTIIYFSKNNLDYALSRLRGDEKETTQKIVMLLLILCCLLSFIIAGFDFRFHWSRVPLPVIIVFSILIGSGYIFLFFVMKQNSFSSRVIEVKPEQKVIDNGAYSIIRHPMYFAFTIIFVFAPIILGSWYALIPATGIPFLLTIRIKNEEEVLKKELMGYDEYIKKVKFKLIPYIW